MSFKLKLHHGGFFQRDPVMQYVGTSNFVSVIDIGVDKLELSATTCAVEKLS